MDSAGESSGGVVDPVPDSAKEVERAQPSTPNASVIPDEVFEAKYPQPTHEVLYRAKRELLSQYRKQVDSEIETLYRYGRYEELHPDAAGTWPKVPAPQEGSIIGWKRVDPSKGDICVMQLPREEYPELYALRDELAWLTSTLSKVDKH